MGFSTEKKRRSNQQRLEALQQKREGSTKRVSLSSTPASQHTVFTDNSDNEQGEVEVKDAFARKDILPLFNQSDNESENDELKFTEKKQFSGRTGEKLFRLQRRIGTDKRFRLDEKFAEESSSEDSDDDDNEMEVVDDISKQLEKEKTNTLKIIDSILGRDTASTPHQNNKVASTLVKPVDLFPRRYDPEATNHSELEQSTPSTTVHSKDLPFENELSDSDDENVTSVAQESSTEKYFTVNSDLKELFTTTSTTCSEGFKFFDDATEVPATPVQDDDNEDATALVHVTPKHHKKHKTESKIEDQHQDTIEDEEETTSRPRVLFFFHADSPTLRNRLDENTFYRTKSLKELELNWAAKRTAMKQCFRKRRKEAMKYSKKKIKKQ